MKHGKLFLVVIVLLIAALAVPVSGGRRDDKKPEQKHERSAPTRSRDRTEQTAPTQRDRSVGEVRSNRTDRIEGMRSRGRDRSSDAPRVRTDDSSIRRPSDDATRVRSRSDNPFSGRPSTTTRRPSITKDRDIGRAQDYGRPGPRVTIDRGRGRANSSYGGRVRPRVDRGIFYSSHNRQPIHVIRGNYYARHGRYWSEPSYHYEYRHRSSLTDFLIIASAAAIMYDGHYRTPIWIAHRNGTYYYSREDALDGFRTKYYDYFVNDFDSEPFTRPRWIPLRIYLLDDERVEIVYDEDNHAYGFWNQADDREFIIYNIWDDSEALSNLMKVKYFYWPGAY